MIKLTLTEKSGEPKLLTFDKDEITIGRVSGNDIVLPKGNVSKRHSRFTVKSPGQIEVADLKSTNGTYVNGRKIGSPMLLSASDRVYVGDFLISIDVGGGAAGGEFPPEMASTAASTGSAARRLPIPPPPPAAAARPRRIERGAASDGGRPRRRIRRRPRRGRGRGRSGPGGASARLRAGADSPPAPASAAASAHAAREQRARRQLRGRIWGALRARRE